MGMTMDRDELNSGFFSKQTPGAIVLFSAHICPVLIRNIRLRSIFIRVHFLVQVVVAVHCSFALPWSGA